MAESDARAPARASAAPAADIPEVSFGEALRFWLKLGFISFGGPAGQIAIMHRELVERRRWVGEERFLRALNYCMLLPGPEAQQLATYIGWLLHGVRGGIVAGALFVLPSVFILLALSFVYCAFGGVPVVVAALWGCKAVVVAIVVDAVVRIGKRALRTRWHYAIAAATFFSIYFLHLPFPWVVLSAALIGFAALPTPTITASASEADVRRTAPSYRYALRILIVGIALWMLPLAALALARGWSSLHVQEYRFFSQVALVTFGGAYAILTYVTQAAVNQFHWITQAQAVDGLALAETTPGPLIMVLQFVGFVAAWQRPEGLSPLASGVLGALLTTWVTFLPSFIFVLVGAPWIESLRSKRRLQGALAGITAAVVGVVLNLAVVFGAAVMAPHGLGAGFDWMALGLAAAAFVALFRFKLDVLTAVVAGALIGLGREWLTR